MAIAKALATYYANAGIVDIKTAEVTINVTIGSATEPVKHTVAEWVADPIYGGVYLQEIINKLFAGTAPVKDQFAEQFANPGTVVLSVSTVDTVRGALELASKAAFGEELLVQGEGYMRVIPTMEEVYAVEDYDSKCGAIGLYFWSINPETEEEAKNYKAIIADFEAAITALNGAKASVAKVISEKNDAITAANNEFKVFADKVTAFNNTIAVYNARKGALTNVLDIIVTNVNKYLGLDSSISYNPDTESFEEALKEAVKTAEYAVSDAQKAVAEAEQIEISDEEIEFLWGISPEAGAQKLLTEYGVRLVYATLGPKGCHVANRNGSAQVASPSGIHVVDTTGAGDIFGGSAMSQFLRLNKAPEDLTVAEMTAVTRFACCAASLSTQTHGGITSVVPEENVRAIL